MAKESPLLEDPKEVPKIDLKDDEVKYVGRILGRLLTAKISRDTNHIEFNSQTYLNQFKNNERLANTTIVRDETNKDFSVNSGTVEQKLQTILAEINRLNLTGEIRVFDSEDNELYELGTAFTDIVHKTEEMELDEENKLLRQLELLKQGTVFIQDNWVKEYRKKKVVTGKFSGKLDDVSWETKLEKCFEGPRRQVLYGPGVYLGNIREFDIKKQPFIFTHKITSYQEAQSRYGEKWDRWANVSNSRVTMVSSDNTGQYDGGPFTITDIDAGMVEEIHYQDKFNNEYQIFLNGTPMLPIGFPLSAISPGGEYNIEKQVLQVINAFFAYGRSFSAKTQQLSDLFDEILRLLTLKTRKSIHPPYANISGKVISERSLMPGAITMNIDPGALVAIGQEGQGATASEYQMLNTLGDRIDKVTVSPQMQGQGGKSGTTAFEVDVLQKQAEKVLSLIVFACSMLEKKTTWLRFNYCLEKYFEPTGTKVDDLRNQLVNKYRKTSTKTTIQGRGSGVRKIIPIENNQEELTPEKVYEMEEYEGVPSKQENGKRGYTREELGMEPVQHIFLDLDVLRNNKYIFFVEVSAKPKDTSMNAKLMFREEIKDVQALMAMGSRPNVKELEATYALLNGRRKEKLFAEPLPLPQEIPEGGAQSINSNSPGMPANITEQPIA